jgi:hypothetical protein
MSMIRRDVFLVGSLTLSGLAARGRRHASIRVDFRRPDLFLVELGKR